MWPLMSGGQPVTVAMHDAPVRELAWVPEMNLLVTELGQEFEVMVGMAAQKRKVNLEWVLNRVWTLHMPQGSISHSNQHGSQSKSHTLCCQWMACFTTNGCE